MAWQKGAVTLCLTPFGPAARVVRSNGEERVPISPLPAPAGTATGDTAGVRT